MRSFVTRTQSSQLLSASLICRAGYRLTRCDFVEDPHSWRSHKTLASWHEGRSGRLDALGNHHNVLCTGVRFSALGLSLCLGLGGSRCPANGSLLTAVMPLNRHRFP